MTENLQKPSILVIIPPPVWALIFMLSAGLLGMAFGVEPAWRYRIAGGILFVFGFLISASGRLAFAKVGTEVHPASAKNSTLVTDGPFSVTRNPMYLGIVVAMIGLAFVVGTWIAFAAAVLFFIFVNWISIPYEEEKMERQFGDAYRDYKQRVRRWI